MSGRVGHLAMIAWVVITFTMVALAINRYVAITRPQQVSSNSIKQLYLKFSFDNHQFCHSIFSTNNGSRHAMSP
jgi:hypothetical protein